MNDMFVSRLFGLHTLDQLLMSAPSIGPPTNHSSQLVNDALAQRLQRSQHQRQAAATECRQATDHFAPRTKTRTAAVASASMPGHK